MDGSWYYRQEGQLVGPVLFETLQELVSARGLSAEDEVRSSHGDWQPASSVAELTFPESIENCSTPRSGHTITHQYEVVAIVGDNRFPVKDLPIVVGRSKSFSDVVIDSKSLSRAHALLISTPTGLLVRDLGSRNGVWYRRRRIIKAVVQDGEMVRLGSVRFTVYAIEVEVPVSDAIATNAGSYAPADETEFVNVGMADDGSDDSIPIESGTDEFDYVTNTQLIEDDVAEESVTAERVRQAKLQKNASRRRADPIRLSMPKLRLPTSPLVYVLAGMGLLLAAIQWWPADHGVRGQVRVEGIPLPVGTLTFTPDNNSTGTRMSVPVVDGEFATAGRDPLTSGRYQVLVTIGDALGAASPRLETSPVLSVLNGARLQTFLDVTEADSKSLVVDLDTSDAILLDTEGPSISGAN